MGWLHLNRDEAPILNATVRRNVGRMGSRQGKAFRGEVHDLSRGSRRAWNLTACFIDIEANYADADAFINLVEGNGHYISFGTGLHASTGLNPLPGYTGVSWVSANGESGEPGLVSLSDAARIQYDPQFGNEWTVVFLEDPSAWRAAVYRSDGTGWLDGVAQTWSPGSGFTTADLSVVDGVVTITSAAFVDLDDVALLPWRVSDAMGVEWSTLPAGAPVFGPLPSLRVSGEMIAESHSYMVGEVTDERFISKPQMLEGNVSSRWVNNARLIDFTLREVPQTFVRSDLL